MAIVMTLSFMLFQKKLEYTENEKIANILNLVNKEYPKVQQYDIAKIMKKASKGNTGNILSKYGYEVDSSFWIKEEKTIHNIVNFKK